VLGYTILYLMNPNAEHVPWVKCGINDQLETLKAKC